MLTDQDLKLKRRLPILIILIISFITISCTSTNLGLTEWDGDTYTFGYDFTEYSEKGFLFTPEKYNRPYDAIGLVEIVIYPKVRQAYSNQNSLSGENSRFVKIGSTYYRIEVPQSDVLIEDMYQKATDLGADALTNFRIDEISLTNNSYQIPSLKISGFAIKRLDK
jgi:hypothetical protein